VLEDTISIINV